MKIVREEKTVNLKNSNIIVAAGMGAADRESISLIKELAHILGGEVACTRPVVDACIMGIDHQVGQTGTTVRPTLYIACGISGQIQHRAGMCQSKRIIAINNDPKAPVFEQVDYGIVDDCREFVPVLIDKIREYQEKQAAC